MNQTNSVRSTKQKPCSFRRVSHLYTLNLTYSLSENKSISVSICTRLFFLYIFGFAHGSIVASQPKEIGPEIPHLTIWKHIRPNLMLPPTQRALHICTQCALMALRHPRVNSHVSRGPCCITRSPPLLSLLFGGHPPVDYCCRSMANTAFRLRLEPICGEKWDPADVFNINKMIHDAMCSIFYVFQTCEFLDSLTPSTTPTWKAGVQERWWK